MKSRLALALGASIVFAGFAAHAQSTDATTSTPTATTGAGAGSIPSDWNDEMRSKFFSDAEQGTLRSEQEVRQGWSELNAEQQAGVRTYCQTHASAGTDMGTSAGAGTSAAATQEGSTAATTDQSAGTSSETTASTTGSGATHMASMTQLCDWTVNAN